MPCDKNTGRRLVFISAPTSPLIRAGLPKASFASGTRKVCRFPPTPGNAASSRTVLVLMACFDGLAGGQVAWDRQVEGKTLYAVLLLDLAGMKATVIQKQAKALECKVVA